MPKLQQLASKGRLVIELPKNPKIADLVTALQALDTRLTVIEPYPTRNDARITALEDMAHHTQHGLIEHQAGAIERLQEIERLRAQLERDRWRTKFRRGRR